MKGRKNIFKKKGARLKDGRDHSEMHEWASRRSFLKATGIFGAGTLAILNGLPVHAVQHNRLTASLLNDDSDRVLVLIRLNGGNDGLNMVIDRGNDEYYRIRPTIAVQESDLWGLNDDIGMSNEMLSLENLWKGGRMKVVQNVGYPQPNFSHFRSSDIWASASRSDEVLETGWIGRAMEAEYISYLEAPPIVPPAIQIGIDSNLIFSGAQSNMALSISNPTEFYRIAQQGQLYTTEGLQNCPSESELRFVRQTANSAFRYSQSIQEAYQKGTTKADYPDESLAEQLAIVARLIKGDLGTKVYMVSIGGFDTHANQINRHPLLMNRLAEAVSAFMLDLDKDNLSNKVLGMTFSEFGRTIHENGSEGTDHGTGAPMLIFGGENLGSEIIGSPPDLINIDQYGDPYYEIDFRDVYASALGDWIGMDDRVLDYMLGERNRIEGLVPKANIPQGLHANSILLGYKTSAEGRVEIRYSVASAGPAILNVRKLDGQLYRTLLSSVLERGSYIYEVKEMDAIAAGSYMIELVSGGKTYRRHVLFK